MQLALSVANGTLTLSTTSGLIFTTGANNSSAMTVQGTLSAINAAIAGLKFTPSSNVAGPASLSLTFNDLGVGGAGPAQLISQSVAIMVKYPVTTVVDQQSGYTETAGVWATSGVTGYNGVAARSSSSSNAAATWKPTLVAGEYQVSIYNPATSGASTDVLVTIANNGKTHTFTINEASGTPGYITLGSFYFAGNGNEYVTISQGAPQAPCMPAPCSLLAKGTFQHLQYRRLKAHCSTPRWSSPRPIAMPFRSPTQASAAIRCSWRSRSPMAR